MSTRDEIIHLSDRLIRDKGFNGFSFHDISRAIGIKTASIHYHFPTKGDLGVATIKEQWKSLETLKDSLANKSPLQKLNGFFSIYEKAKSEKMVCLVGSLATDLNTVDKKIKVELTSLAAEILLWLTETLEEGKLKKVFHFNGSARTKALMIITNMLGIVQLMRLTGQPDFDVVKHNILKELKTR